MGTVREAPHAKLVCAVMHRPSADPDPLLARLAGLWGPVESRSASLAFDGTDYYEKEMGPGLRKFLVSFAPTVPQDRLAGIKLATNGVEAETADAGGGRVFNLDPGLVTLHNLVLATTKGYSHRIYVSEGIWEEVTLRWHDGCWRALPWTYADYQRQEVLAFLAEVRESLKRAERRAVL